MEKHFVTYYFPGTIVANESEKPVDSWDVGLAKHLAPANSYGFRFTTRSRGDYDLDSKVSKTSGFYFLKGRVETLEQVEQRVIWSADPARHPDRILLDNMKCNGWNEVVRTSSYTLPLQQGDVVLSYS